MGCFLVLYLNIVFTLREKKGATNCAAEPLSQTVTYNKYAPACEEWLFLVLHLNIALTLSVKKRRITAAEPRLVPKSRTPCTLGFGSSRAFLVIHPFGHAHIVAVCIKAPLFINSCAHSTLGLLSKGLFLALYPNIVFTLREKKRRITAVNSCAHSTFSWVLSRYSSVWTRSHSYGLCKILHICHVEPVETSSRKAHNLLISYRYARFFDALRMTRKNVNIAILSLRADLFGVAISRERNDAK